VQQKHWTALAVLRQFIEDNGYAPTIRELAPLLGVQPATARVRVKELAVHGYVHFGDHKYAGAYSVTEKAELVSG